MNDSNNKKNEKSSSTFFNEFIIISFLTQFNNMLRAINDNEENKKN